MVLGPYLHSLNLELHMVLPVSDVIKLLLLGATTFSITTLSIIGLIPTLSANDTHVILSKVMLCADTRKNDQLPKSQLAKMPTVASWSWPALYMFDDCNLQSNCVIYHSNDNVLNYKI